MKRVSSKTKKKNSYHFYNGFKQYERSKLNSTGLKHNTSINEIKYRCVTESYKEEIRLEGRLLPSTIEKRGSKRKFKTYLSENWSYNTNLRSELYSLVNFSLFWKK